MNTYRKELSNEEFIEMLNDIYDPYTIDGISFYAGEILYSLDNIAFREYKLNFEDSSCPWVCDNCQSEYDDRDEAENCCKRDRLCELLEHLGYEGTDASIEESLFCYGIVRCVDTGHTILYSEASELFAFCVLDDEYILEGLKYMNDGFYSFIGMDKSTYASDTSMLMILSDVMSYSNVLTDDLEYDITIDDLIALLEGSIKNENRQKC